MNTITNNNGVMPTGPVNPAQDQTAQLKPAVGRPASAEPSTGPSPVGSDANLSPSKPEPKTGQQYLDPDQMRDFVAKVGEAIRKASVEPHTVGYAPDPDSEGYLVEIKRADGTLITRFSPEKVLNLNGFLDDLSGMVIDLKT